MVVLRYTVLTQANQHWPNTWLAQNLTRHERGPVMGSGQNFLSLSWCVIYRTTQRAGQCCWTDISVGRAGLERPNDIHNHIYFHFHFQRATPHQAQAPNWKLSFCTSNWREVRSRYWSLGWTAWVAPSSRATTIAPSIQLMLKLQLQLGLKLKLAPISDRETINLSCGCQSRNHFSKIRPNSASLASERAS